MDPSAAFSLPSSGASSSAFDLSEVDFEYVAKLTKKDAKRLRAIIIALEAEAAYPDLLKAAREKLKEIDPKSAPVTFSGPSPDEAKDALADLASWTSAAKSKDEALRAAAKTTGGRVATTLPVRGHVESAFEDEPKPATATKKGEKKPLDLGQELNKAKLLPPEITLAALNEKEKGNDSFRAKEYDDAIKYYTRSLHLVPNDTTTLNNRAITFIKQKAWDSALNDIALVLQVEPKNWKALMRRGQVQEGKLFLERALDDFKLASEAWSSLPENAGKELQADLKKSIKKVEQALFEQEPNHPYVAHLKKPGAAASKSKESSKKEESKENKESEEPTSAPKTQQFKRMAISEVEDEDEDDEDEQEEKVPEPQSKSTSAPAPAPTSSMKRMPIEEVDDDDEDAEEVVIPAKKPTTTPAPAPAPVTAKPPPKPTAPQPKPKQKSNTPIFQSKSGGMTIEVVSDEDEEEEVVKPSASNTKSSTAAATTSSASTSSTTSSSAAADIPLPPVPTSAVAFERDWLSLRSQAPARLFDYLRRLAPVDLAKLFTRAGSLSLATFTQIIGIVVEQYLKADFTKAVQVLIELQQTDRFALNVNMVDGKTKKELKSILESKLPTADDATKTQIQTVLKRYT